MNDAPEMNEPNEAAEPREDQEDLQFAEQLAALCKLAAELAHREHWRVTGKGSALVTYAKEGFSQEQVTGAKLPWRKELAFPPRSMVERGYNVAHWTDMPRGGHFAGLEEPELLLADLRSFVAGLR